MREYPEHRSPFLILVMFASVVAEAKTPATAVGPSAGQGVSDDAGYFLQERLGPSSTSAVSSTNRFRIAAVSSGKHVNPSFPSQCDIANPRCPLWTLAFPRYRRARSRHVFILAGDGGRSSAFALETVHSRRCGGTFLKHVLAIASDTAFAASLLAILHRQPWETEDQKRKPDRCIVPSKNEARSTESARTLPGWIQGNIATNFAHSTHRPLQTSQTTANETISPRNRCIDLIELTTWCGGILCFGDDVGGLYHALLRRYDERLFVHVRMAD